MPSKPTTTTPVSTSESVTPMPVLAGHTLAERDSQRQLVKLAVSIDPVKFYAHTGVPLSIAQARSLVGDMVAFHLHDDFGDGACVTAEDVAEGREIIDTIVTIDKHTSNDFPREAANAYGYEEDLDWANMVWSGEDLSPKA